MRYGIFSDVHGNLEALSSTLNALSEEHIDQYLCVGDIVGYGANPCECIELIKQHNVICVAGNHDWAVLGKIDTKTFSFSAQKGVEWTKGQLSEQDVQYLRNLPLIYNNIDLVVVHGSLRDPQDFHYLIDRGFAAEMFGLLKSPIAFIGHTHVAGVLRNERGKIEALAVSGFDLDKECRYIVNVGSVGQPRDHDPKSAYCIYDTKEHKVTFHRVDYDIRQAQDKIIAAGLPQNLANRLTTGT